ncbi:MAG: HAD hydrolase-like protein [Trueperaceae bacterium]
MADPPKVRRPNADVAGSVRFSSLTGVRGAMLDLDGCTWFGGTLAPGASAFVHDLRAAGVRVGFLTNASVAPGARFAAMLRERGLPCPDRHMLAPLDLLLDDLVTGEGRYLAPNRPLLALASVAVCDALTATGVPIVLPTDAVGTPRVDAVVLGRDARLDYRDLTVATRALRAGARLIALNGDARIPSDDGDVVPGPGAVASLLQVASGVAPTVVGKPSRAFFDAALTRFGMDRSGTVMIGDNPFTDVAGGIGAGLRTVWIDLGTFRDGTGPDGRPPPSPDLVVGSLTDLHAQMEVEPPR